MLRGGGDGGSGSTFVSVTLLDIFKEASAHFPMLTVMKPHFFDETFGTFQATLLVVTGNNFGSTFVFLGTKPDFFIQRQGIFKLY